MTEKELERAKALLELRKELFNVLEQQSISFSKRAMLGGWFNIAIVHDPKFLDPIKEGIKAAINEIEVELTHPPLGVRLNH